MGHLSQGEEEEEDGPAGASLGAHLYQVFLHPVVHKVDTTPNQQCQVIFTSNPLQVPAALLASQPDQKPLHQ